MKHRVPRPVPFLLALGLSLAACGEGAAGEAEQAGGAEPAPVATGSAKPACPTPAEVQTAVGFPVRSHPVAGDQCIYELTGDYTGVMISLMYQPAARAEDVFADIRRGVQGALGASAQPDRLTVGEGGWGYSSLGRKVAAAVSRGRLYHAEIDHDLFDNLQLPDDVAVRMIELGMRTAPGEAAAGSDAPAAAAADAPMDACLLATNAEVSEIAETPREFAQYWSAPVVSLGGTNCDYDGGSIRVYRGRSAAADFEATLERMKADNARRTAVSGLGDRAEFMIPFPDDRNRRIGLLVVHDGPRVVQLTLDPNGNEPIEATRPRLERLARLVLPRLR